MTDTTAAERLRGANRRLRARLVASAHLLDVPFSNEPTLSPWELVKRDLAALDEAVKGTPADDAEQELASFRDGYLQLCWDHHTEHSPHQTSYNHADEPVTQVQYTYEGKPAWHCAACLRVTLMSDDEVDICRGCGADELQALFYETPCTDEDHEGLRAP